MTSKKSTKSALLTSSLALLLCFSMLLGTTFAWFTDSVTSANNIITAGNLDVELYYKTTEMSEWGTVASTTNVFKENTLWEPGHAEVVQLRVVNAGTLALKYQLGVNVASEIGSKNVAGQDFKLSDYIKYAVIDGTQSYNNSAEAAAAAENATANKLNVAYDSGVINLENGKEKIVTLVVYMPTSVGNEANYLKGEAVPSINLGINLAATQLNSEADSFGTEYDKDLETSENGISRVLGDGSTVFYYNEESGFEGRVRLTALPENLGSEYVVPTGVNDLGGELNSVILDKLTIPAGIQYAYKSLAGATIKEVVLAEGTTTIPNRIFYNANVNKVVIPSSVTKIEQNAFANASGVTSLVIPASVTTVEESAFQHMTNLTTVTFEGNTAIQGYAFRGCSALRTVNLKGDNVTFIKSLTGKNSCWFCNSESNNPGVSNITFNVINDTVAARVKMAMGAECPDDTTKSTVEIYVNGAQYYIGTKQP